ncbi:pyridoxal phosphate-dependent aminotransferase family protein [Aminobacter sp. SR38]|jgi:glycine C-acetyltransferase/8-amino-7-oxononanoate synthase|uniref:aminotransferase class I/II-fold pyridoxal phosphate-dependent enzyme n=1 Tax=Aminobacter sp. SR38 TaxID=2774562 RepID=UPI00177ABD58|nr:pyridoxal phosphate-dependent aminotransferase family protein [Aminobacter sp. SR38]QOF69028.1 pyridoxal phosphate-dependent aminotransferase family protein [Aminobacter sp. SR38]
MTAPFKMESPIGSRMVIAGREVDYYCGTSYFCLHGHPEVIEAACAATRQYGMGPGTLAHMQVYADLQERLRQWFGTEEVVYMISGYTSPMVLLQGLREDFDLVFIDAATHYSTRDAIPTLGKPVHEFRHGDANDLAEQLALHVGVGQRPAVLTDGVFPSSGRLAPLNDFRQAMAPYDGALLCIDDSHGVGVLGETGRGSLQHAGLEGEGNFLAGTMSKAFGALGGVVPGDAILAEKITRNAMIMRGASPAPPGLAAAAAASLRILQTTDRRSRLSRNVSRMRSGLRGLGFEVADTPVPIVTIKGVTDLELLRDRLAERDIIVRVQQPGGYSDASDVPSMRLAVFSEHSPDQIDRLLRSMAELL